MSVTTYLNFAGNTREVFMYYHSIFGGEAPQFMTYADLPPQGHPDGDQMDPNLKPLILHVEYPLMGGKLMGADVPEGYPVKHKEGNNFSVAVESENLDEIKRVYALFKKDAQAELMPLGPQFFSPLYGNLVDKYGISWQFIGLKSR